jgi:uncharacterized protein YkwD
MADTTQMGRRTALVACAVALLAACVMPGAIRSAVDSRTTLTALETGVLAQLNAIRVQHGLKPLKLNRELTAAARQHTFEMVDDGYFQHDSAGGTPFDQRIKQFYPPGAGAHWLFGENLLWSSPDVDAKGALAIWMASPGHRANILTPGWREIGIAAVHADSAGGDYDGLPVTVVTTDFGARG